MPLNRLSARIHKTHGNNVSALNNKYNHINIPNVSIYHGNREIEVEIHVSVSLNFTLQGYLLFHLAVLLMYATKQLLHNHFTDAPYHAESMKYGVQ